MSAKRKKREEVEVKEDIIIKKNKKEKKKRIITTTTIQYKKLIFPLWICFNIALIGVFLALKQSIAAVMTAVCIVYTILIWWCVGKVDSKYSFINFMIWVIVYLIFVELIVLGLLVKLDIEADSSNALSPCGKSSCDPNTDTTNTYNPGGWYQRIEPYLACPHLDCRWGDVTDETIISFDSFAGNGSIDLSSPCTDDECAHLASTITTHYPDKGKGIEGGWYTGVTTTSIGYCPGVDSTRVNPVTNVVGYGKHVCSACSLYLRREPWLFRDSGADHCSGDPYNWMCFLCIDASMRQNASDRRYTWIWYIVHIVSLIALVVARSFLTAGQRYPSSSSEKKELEFQV